MEDTTYVTLSAQVALQHQLEVVANNIANANTSGYKADRQLFQTYVNRLAVPGNQVAFVQDRATYFDRSAGQFQTTDNPFDLAIDGDGFLSVRTPQGPFYSRDGRLHLSPDRTLVDTNSNPLLGEDGQPIQLPDDYTRVRVEGDGTVSILTANSIDWQDIGRIATYRPVSPETLRKAGNGLVSAPPNGMTLIPAQDTGSRIMQGTVEASTVQPVKEIANMTELSRAYERLQTLLSDDNDRERTMIQTLGRTN
ncbi:MAG TPA: flagellar basal-body rod protein FlgF [Acetobacteraceae bacterium]|nr:flagellar basal-body rod protein FlgF [Acetobacteraceae bacterium]